MGFGVGFFPVKRLFLGVFNPLSVNCCCDLNSGCVVFLTVGDKWDHNGSKAWGKAKNASSRLENAGICVAGCDLKA